MADSILDQPHFNDPTKAREYLERIRWPGGAICPHCGSIGDHYALQGKAPSSRPLEMPRLPGAIQRNHRHRV